MMTNKLSKISAADSRTYTISELAREFGVTPRALREELRDLDAEMNSLHQSLYDAAARFGAALPRSELGAAPVATAARDVPLP